MNIAPLREALAVRRDPARAAQMQAYMKSAMPYHGVPMPELRTVFRELFAGMSWADAAAWAADVRTLWHGAAFREERYAALMLAGHRRARRFQTPDALPLYEELIVSGAWWDLVDDVATHRIGPILLAYPDQVRPRVIEWSRSDDLWLRRTSIICQVGLKADTDQELLRSVIEPSIESREFFLRKAIGWALREHSKTDPDFVRAYVAEKAHRLSGLSRQEALRRL